MVIEYGTSLAGELDQLKVVANLLKTKGQLHQRQVS